MAPLFALALATGCAQGADEADENFTGVPTDVGQLAPTEISPNGVSLNGTSLNGASLNGTSLSGVTLNYVNLAGATLGGVPLTNVDLHATNFSGKKSGTAISNAGFVGATFSGILSNSSTLRLRVDSRTQLTGSNTDLYAYSISYETSSGWSPLCGLDGTQPVQAMPLDGYWDQRQGVTGGGAFTNSSTRFTFACRQHVIAKCVELGYKPWKTVGGVGLQNHHQACTRLLRADYCGDGKSWTVDGTSINLYDNLGVQTDSQPWTVEAEWTAAGARYVTTTTRRRYLMLGATVPACVPAKVSATTGQSSHYSTGTLLINEY
ncbi:MAG: pentapeptide repeat-containing protein [Polyangiaceae bacterium]|jgi:hypothetical protein|nr:pentapeptide repeat-containing protein [Polyangiaceae bacterium]